MGLTLLPPGYLADSGERGHMGSASITHTIVRGGVNGGKRMALLRALLASDGWFGIVSFRGGMYAAHGG
jgi:hypothetical protein